MSKEDFYKDQYFKQLNERLDTLEDKLDIVGSKVTWIYAWSAGVGAAAAFIFNALKLI